jgi:hypothetical protein
MMPSTRRSLLLVACSLAAASCATIEREEVAAPASGGTVAMRVGTPLIISLPPDPDAGYGWVLRSATPNLQVVGGPDYTPQPKPWVSSAWRTPRRSAFARRRREQAGSSSPGRFRRAPRRSPTGWCATT